MRYSIAAKFLAVLLCAASLFAVVTGVGGMLALESMGLYEQSVEQLQNSALAEKQESLARDLVHQHASAVLGACPEQVVKDYFSLWDLENALAKDQIQYVITLEDGTILADNRGTSDWRGQTVVMPFSGVGYLQLADSGAKLEDAVTWYYYDRELQTTREAIVTIQTVPNCQVEIYVEPDILGTEGSWQLLRAVWPYRNDFLKLAGVGAAVFAVTLVYLCWAAGHRPGSEEILAGGLNRVSLDLYAAVLCGCVAGVLILGVRVVYYLLEENLQTALLVGGVLTGGLCLLVVGFLFALAAQVKMPGYYWLKNTLCGWCCVLLVWLCRKGAAFVKWIWSWAWPLTKRVFRAGWKLLRFFWRETKNAVKTLFSWICRCFRWCAEKLLRFFGMLPLTWQWLVGGFMVIFLLFFTILTWDTGFVLLGIASLVGLVLYGAYAFGILLESAKHMSRGDLDVPVDDRLLIGCFREFGEELDGLNNAVRTAAQKQLKSERMKTELITNVSHDIKTPLTSIINYLDLMSRPHTEEEQELYLEVLNRQSQRLKKLIEDLMEMSKASTGNMTVELTSIDAVEAVNQALGEFADKLDKAGLTPVFHHPQEDVIMQADGRLVWRVMSNLLGNAIKYALPGTRLYVDVTALEGKVMISMKNISREELNVDADELMERFVRGDASRNTEGSGLGLNIARSLMELQRGSMQLLVDGDLFKVTLVFLEN